MKTIGIFLGTTEDAYGKEVVRGAVEGLKGSGHRLVCFTSGSLRSHHGYEAQRNVLYQLVDGQSLDGLIVCGSLSHNVSHAELEAFCRRYEPLPLVTLSVSLPGIPSVVTDNRTGISEVMDHLLVDHGLTRLAFVAGPPGQQESELRKAVFVEKLREAGLEVNPEWVVHGDYTRDSGAEAGHLLGQALDRHPGQPRFQAIVSANDSMAFGVQETLEARGLRFPHDVVITGFDDAPEGRIHLPALTTVWQSSGHQAEAAARVLLRWLGGEVVPQVTRILPTLLVRQSCGCSASEAIGNTKEERLLPVPKGQYWRDVLSAEYANAVKTGDPRRFSSGVRDFLEQESLQEPATFARALLARLALGADERAKGYLFEAQSLVTEAALRWESRARTQTEDLLDRLRGTTEDMLTSETFPQLLDVLQNTLVHMGFAGFWLSLFLDPKQPTLASRLHVARAPGGRAANSVEGTVFPSRELVPGGLGNLDPAQTLLVVEALYSRNARLGFIVFASDLNGTQITGTLRGQLSGALQAVLLLEERKQAELQLIQSEKMAALGSLVAGVAHEINTPLGVSITASSFLAVTATTFSEKFQRGELTRSEFERFMADLKQVGESIHTNLARAADLISSFKQISADQASEQRRKFALKEYLQEALISLHFQWKNRAIDVQIEGDNQQTLDSYPGAIVQIVSNLLSNSLLHAYAKDEAGTITLTVENRGASVLLTFADNGAGIPPEIVNRIFEPFFTTKRGRGGTGLGLHIVFNLVTSLLGGVIACQSTPGQGTRFTMLLPRSADSA